MMQDFLRKLKLITDFTVELDMSKDEFIDAFHKSVDEGSVSFMSAPFETFSTGKNDYKGHISEHYFKIRKKRRLFDTSMNLALAEGKYKQKEQTLLIETNINAFSGFMKLFFVLTGFIYLCFIITFLAVDRNQSETPWIILSFIVIHASFMMGIPFLIMRRSVKRMQRDLEREFFYMTRYKTQ